ncbi:MAG: hypothetical protein RRB13_11400 [bacterium]|nr:hypothetical protein [bacterium]
MKKADLAVVFSSAIAMAQRDGKLDKKEAQLIQELLDKAKLTLSDVGGLDSKPGAKDPDQAVLALSSVKAKRTYLLTLACVALSDGELADEELSYFAEKAIKLGVGTIDLSNLTFEKAVVTVKRILNEVVGGESKFTGGQLSDIDLL